MRGARQVDGARPDVVIPPRVIPWHQFPVVQAINGRWLARAILSATAPIFGGRPPIVISSSPVAAYAMPHLPHAAVVYFCLDEYAAMDGVDPAIVLPAERRMLEIADLVLVTASTMLATKVPASGAIQHLPQGVNYEHFAAEGPVDPAVAALPHPRLGFSGTIEPRLDLPILGALADRFPEGSVILVGEPRMSLGALGERRNVVVLPRREYRDLPATLRGFDVGLIPYTLSDWTRAVDPLKLLEYLAAGLPVVSTPLPEVLRHAPPVLIGGEDGAGFAAATVDAVRQGASEAEARRRYAARHAWERRAETFSSLIDALVARNV
jgi:glycosyltransferase involved in cell wall biosynthesis